MRKGIVIILSVAILGAIGVYTRGHNTSASTPGSSSVLSTNTQGSSQSSASSQTASSNASTFKDGSYTGRTSDTPYGPVQVAVVVSGGKITTVNLLQMPSDRGHTQEVTAVAGPLLKQTTLAKQSANIDFVSGATSTSEGYQQSLQSALNQAV